MPFRGERALSCTRPSSKARLQRRLPKQERQRRPKEWPSRRQKWQSRPKNACRTSGAALAAPGAPQLQGDSAPLLSTRGAAASDVPTWADCCRRAMIWASARTTSSGTVTVEVYSSELPGPPTCPRAWLAHGSRIKLGPICVQGAKKMFLDPPRPPPHSTHIGPAGWAAGLP